MADFPTADRKHKVNNAAKAALNLAQPASWNVDLSDGDNDFGIDAQVQVDIEGQVRYAFKVQLKGTESPEYSSDHSRLSIALKRTTLNYYATLNDEVLLVVAVVTLLDNGKLDHSSARVYWTWMTTELRRIRGSRFAIDMSEQGEVTVHVPVENLLTPTADARINAHLEERLRAARATEKLEDILAAAVEGRQNHSPLEQLATLTNGRLHQLLAALSDEPASAVVASTGSAKADALHAECLGYLRAGSTELAARFLETIDRSVFATTSQARALLRSLEGKVAMQQRQRDRALSCFDEAYSLDPGEPHLLAKEEVRFLAAVDADDVNAIREVAQSLVIAASDDGLSLLVRVHASIRQFKEAEACIQRISTEKQVVPRLVLLSSLGKWEEVHAIASAKRQDPALSPQDRVAVTLIAARACWQRALASALVDPDAKELPINGVPGLDRNAAAAACDLSIRCLADLKQLGWPPNVELIAPIAVACACSVGRQSEISGLMREAAAARPAYPELQESVELLGVATDDQALALEANARLVPGHETLARRACLLFQARRFDECLTAALEAGRLEGPPCRQTPMAYATGVAAAARLARLDNQASLLSMLTSRNDWGPFVYFARFAEASAAGRKADALTPLRQGLHEFPGSWMLAANLFSNLDVSEADGAREAIPLSRILRRYSSLAGHEWTQLISAHITLQEWQEAETEARNAIAHHGEQERFVSGLAIAAEMQGRTGEAVRALERFVALGHRRSTTLRNYLGLCLRLGRMPAALQTIGQLLELERDREERIELMRLRALILLQQGQGDEARELALAMGKLTDRESEVEEGTFINLFMAVTVQGTSPPTAAQMAEFQPRMEAFCERWPESGVFRRYVATDESLAKPDAVFEMLDSVLGEDSRARMKEFLLRERQARDGELPVPFIARPGFVLHYVSDPFTLWNYSKRASSEDKQFHLTCNFLDEPPSRPQSLREVPLVDLTALFVLHDLGLLDLALAMFRRIAIPRRTVDYLSQQSRGLLASASSAGLATELLEWVNRNLDRVDQPSADNALMKGMQPRAVMQDYVKLACSKRWTIYTDDAFLRAWIRSEVGQVDAISTPDLLSFADAADLIRPEEASGHLATLVSWNVGVTVSGRHLIASLHGAVSDDSGMHAAERLDAFQVHEPFAKLSRAIWFPGKGAQNLIRHMSSVLVEILGQSGSNDDSIAALWGFWLIRIRLDPEVGGVGIDPLAVSLAIALRALPRASAPRLISIYKTVVEITTGDAMSQSVHDQAIVRIAQCVATLAIRNAEAAEDLRSRIATALVPGTTDGDLFAANYFERQRSAAAESAKPDGRSGERR
jgi:tetratricopeptide (TPR) repeat protein